MEPWKRPATPVAPLRPRFPFNLNLPAGAGAISNVTPFTLNGQTGFAAIANGYLYSWVGSSDGSFQAPSSGSIGAYSPVQLAAADLKGDQLPDIVVLGGGQFSTSQYILPLYGNSIGIFSANSLTGPGVYGSEMLIADVNGDGHPDIILSEFTQGLTVLLNQGDGSFAHPATFSAGSHITSNGTTPDIPSTIATADLNGDGVPDLITVDGHNAYTNVDTNSITVYVGRTTAEFPFPVDYAVGNEPTGIALANVNGKVSAFVSNGGDSNVSFLQGNGDGTFQPQTTFTGGSTLAEGAGAVAIVAGSIDGSGIPGVIVGDGAGGITVFTSSGSSWKSTAQYTTSTTNGVPSINSMALVDLNGDGNLDLLVSTGATCGYSPQGMNITNNGSVLIFPGVGNGTFSTPISAHLQPSRLESRLCHNRFVDRRTDP